jgi:hypothetical protein
MTVQTFTPPSNGLAIADPSSAVGSIVRWANDLITAGQAIDLIVETPFVPDSFWPMPPGMTSRDWPTPKLRHPRESLELWQGRRQIAVASASSAVVYGDAIGYAPPAALQSIYVVKGRPGLYAEAMKALVVAAGHEIEQEDLSDTRCVMVGKRRGRDTWQRATFTIDRARKAGYMRNSKYAEDPQSMLVARATSIICRIVAPDVLKGLVAVEELQDEDARGDGTAAPTRTVTARRTAARALPSGPPAAQASQGQPVTPAGQRQAGSSGQDAGGDDLLDYDQPPAKPEPITPARWGAINAQLRDLAVSGEGQQAARLGIVSHLVGRSIAKGSDLTSDEGRAVWDTLDAAGTRIVWDILGSDSGFPITIPDVDVPEGLAEEIAADTKPAADVVDELLDDGDPNQQWDDIDGAEADAEAQP